MLAERISAGACSAWPRCWPSRCRSGWRLLVLLAAVLGCCAAAGWRCCRWLALALAWPQVQRGLPLHLAVNNYQLSAGRPAMRRCPPIAAIPRTKLQALKRQNTLRLLSANVRIFNVYAAPAPARPQRPRPSAIAWLAASPRRRALPPGVLPGAGRHPDQPTARLFRVAERLGAGERAPGVCLQKPHQPRRSRVWAGYFFAAAHRGAGRNLVRPPHPEPRHVGGRRAGPGRRRHGAHLQRPPPEHEPRRGRAGGGRHLPGRPAKPRAGACCGRFVRGAAARAWQADTLAAHLAALALPGAARRRPQRPALFVQPTQQPGQPSCKTPGLPWAWAPATPTTAACRRYCASTSNLRVPQWQVLACRVHDEVPVLRPLSGRSVVPSYEVARTFSPRRSRLSACAIFRRPKVRATYQLILNFALSGRLSCKPNRAGGEKAAFWDPA